MKPWYVMLGAAAALALTAACSHDPTGSANLSADQTTPRMIGLDSLRTVNDSSLPCCSLTAGSLTFYYPSHPTDYVATPNGMVPKTCVIGVPNGELLDPRKGVAVSSDGVTIPILPCTTGEYRVAVRDSAGGGEEVLSSGAYTWAPDSLWHSLTLTLVDSKGVLVSTRVEADTIEVGLGARSYVFQVISAE